MPISSNWLTHDFGWNEAAGRYMDLTTGRFVSFADVNAALELQVINSEMNIAAVTEQLRAGTINLAEWQLAMEQEIKVIHTASAASARGGWAQMTQADWGWVGQRVRVQYQYLNNFAAQIANGQQPLNGRALQRAKMYAQAGRSTFQEMRRRYTRIYKGAVTEARVLTPNAEHCEGGDNRPGCIELANMGRVPVGTLPPIGAAQCLTFCQCTFRFFDAEGKAIGED